MKRRYLLVVSLPLALSAAFLSGCNGQSGNESNISPMAQSPSNAPAGSTAAESQEKTGHDHHATAAGELKAHTHSTKLTFRSEPEAIPVGKPSTWTLTITDVKSGQPVNDFEIEMTKLMHLIVVKKDLSWFNHIHPQFKGNGTFVVTTSLPTPGSYKLYADYTPKGKTQEIPQYEFATGGEQPKSISASLVADKVKGAWMSKKVVAHPEGTPDAAGGATYEVALMPMPMPLVAGQNAMLHFQIRDAKGQPIKDLQPYLGAMGHAVILSSDTNSYLHSHPMAGGMEEMDGMKHDMSAMKMNDAPAPKSGGPDVIFHTNFPTPGLYKAWGQFMHKGQIITAAFVLNVGAPKPGDAGGTATPPDESQPHSH